MSIFNIDISYKNIVSKRRERKISISSIIISIRERIIRQSTMNYKEIEQRNIDAFSSALLTRIKEICKKEKTTLSEWAINSGVTPSTLYDFKNKKTITLGLIVIKKLCDSIKMSMSEFFNFSLFNEINFDE